MNIYQPYTYLIGWSAHNKYYYGVRYAKNCNTEELWVSYFTSSKHVKLFKEQNGEPDIIEVRKIFDNAEKAQLWEHKVLKRMNVINNDKWINKTDNMSISQTASVHYGDDHWLRKIGGWNSDKAKELGLQHPMLNKKHSEKTKKEISFKLLAKNHPMWGKKQSKETVSKKAKSMIGKNLGKKRSEEQRLNLKKAMLKCGPPFKKGSVKEKTPCLYCKKMIDKMNMKKWHGEKCKLNTI